MKDRFQKFLLGVLCLTAFPAMAAQRIHVMILDGESAASYHKWKVVTPILKKELDETGLFDVDVVTAPPAGGDYSSFKPEWNKYQVVVFNYDAPSERWPAELKESFEKYMKDGGGMVTVHAADNAFNGWNEFNEMIGIGGWRGRNEASGPHWYYKDGKLASDPGPGRAGVHGLRIPYKVTLQNTQHPIVKGLPKVWVHQGDESHNLVRSQQKTELRWLPVIPDPQLYGRLR